MPRRACNFSPLTYNFSRGLRKRRAYAYRFPGIVLAWGRQNRGREQSLNPYEFHLAFYFFSALALPACKDDANHPKVSTNIT
jgi:hypothetical protein